MGAYSVTQSTWAVTLLFAIMGCRINASKRLKSLGKGRLKEPREIIRELIVVLVFNMSQLGCT